MIRASTVATSFITSSHHEAPTISKAYVFAPNVADTEYPAGQSFELPIILSSFPPHPLLISLSALLTAVSQDKEDETPAEVVARVLGLSR